MTEKTEKPIEKIKPVKVKKPKREKGQRERKLKVETPVTEDGDIVLWGLNDNKGKVLVAIRLNGEIQINDKIVTIDTNISLALKALYDKQTAIAEAQKRYTNEIRMINGQPPLA